MKNLSFFVAFLLAWNLLAAETAPEGTTSSLPNSGKVAEQTTYLDTVEIGNDDFFTPFILEGSEDFGEGDAAVKEQIDSRDFAADEFYMRNIDREEFEQERLLMLFVDEDQNRKFKTWVQLREEEEDEEEKNKF